MSIKIKKIISAIIQNNDKGGDDLVEYMIEQTSMCWEEKKNLVRIQGQKANGKLLIPIMIMFIGILIMVVVPMFGSMMM